MDITIYSILLSYALMTKDLQTEQLLCCVLKWFDRHRA